jgi:hypothetical protein
LGANWARLMKRASNEGCTTGRKTESRRWLPLTRRRGNPGQARIATPTALTVRLSDQPRDASCMSRRVRGRRRYCHRLCAPRPRGARVNSNNQGTERQLFDRQLALDVAEGKIGERAFLAAIRRVSEEEARIGDGGRQQQSVYAARALDYIRNFASSWAMAKPPTRATMIQSLYEEIVVRGSEFVSVRLTPEAYAHGLALACRTRSRCPRCRRGGDLEKMGIRARQDLSVRML